MTGAGGAGPEGLRRPSGPAPPGGAPCRRTGRRAWGDLPGAPAGPPPAGRASTGTTWAAPAPVAPDEPSTQALQRAEVIVRAISGLQQRVAEGVDMDTDAFRAALPHWAALRDPAESSGHRRPCDNRSR